MRLVAAAVALPLALGAIGGPARAQDDDGPLSATITLASDYIFRGQSQTDRRAAYQGGLDYAHSSGVFAGLWASSINFNDEPNSPAEVDFTAGYSHAFSDVTEGSLAGAYYWYPDSEPADYDYFEIIGRSRMPSTHLRSAVRSLTAPTIPAVRGRVWA